MVHAYYGKPRCLECLKLSPHLVENPRAQSNFPATCICTSAAFEWTSMNLLTHLASTTASKPKDSPQGWHGGVALNHSSQMIAQHVLLRGGLSTQLISPTLSFSSSVAGLQCSSSCSLTAPQPGPSSIQRQVRVLDAGYALVVAAGLHPPRTARSLT